MTPADATQALQAFIHLGYPQFLLIIPCPTKGYGQRGQRELRALGFDVTLMSITSRRQWWLLIEGGPA